MEIKTFKISDLPIHEQADALSKARIIFAQLFHGYKESGEISEYEDAIQYSANYNTIVAFIGDAIVGSITQKREKDGQNNDFILFIDRLAVDPKYQRQGVGSALLETLVGFALQYAIPAIGTISTVPPGRSFFIKNGFSPTDTTDTNDAFLTKQISI